MSSLATGFATRMSKRPVGSEGETTSSSNGKWMKLSFPDEGTQKDWAIISVDSPD